MKICICGGGALGHTCAGFFLSNPHNQVNIYSGHPEQWSEYISVQDCNGVTFSGYLNKVTNLPENTVKEQDIILLCLPGFLIQSTLLAIKPYIGDAVVGSIVSSTGFFFEAHSILSPNTKLFGFQRVPFISRVKEYGKSAMILGYKTQLNVAFENIADKESFRNILSELFHTRVSVLNSFYEAALSNSNPILHPARLYSLFHNSEEVPFQNSIPFYSNWSDKSSRLLIDMDAEFFQLVNKLDIQNIQTLLDYYGCSNATTLTKKISTINAFKDIMSPMRKENDKWLIDWESRYFIEDFPFGLKFIKELCDYHNIYAPNISKVYDWGITCLQKYGKV